MFLSKITYLSSLIIIFLRELSSLTIIFLRELFQSYQSYSKANQLFKTIPFAWQFIYKKSNKQKETELNNHKVAIIKQNLLYK